MTAWFLFYCSSVPFLKLCKHVVNTSHITNHIYYRQTPCYQRVFNIVLYATVAVVDAVAAAVVVVARGGGRPVGILWRGRPEVRCVLPHSTPTPLGATGQSAQGVLKVCPGCDSRCAQGVLKVCSRYAEVVYCIAQGICKGTFGS